MNLAWIIALLRPLDIASHPNFRDADYDARPEVQLAGLVSGDPHRSRYSGGTGDETLDLALRNAELILTGEGVRVGLNGLLREVTYLGTDLARTSAFGLLACYAAGRLDDFSSADRVLNVLLERAVPDRPESALVRAALLQQQSLRFRDSGRKHSAQSVESLQLLDEYELRDFVEFPLSPGVNVSHIESIRHVVTALRHAVWNLSPRPFREREGEQLPGGFPASLEMVRIPKSNQFLKIDRLRATEYAKFVEDSFKRVFRSQARTIGGRGAPDLSYALLNAEMIGDISVYRLRKESALMKLLTAGSGEPSKADVFADAVQLLRDSGAKSELDLTVERIRASGPLEALRNDCVQIIRHRTEPRMLRASDLRVLRGGAELLSREEASSALQAVRRLIAWGGVQVPPGHSQLEIVRLEPAWLTAAHLANVAAEDDIVSNDLLNAGRACRPGDELYDKAIGRALRRLNWENVTAEKISQWRDFFTSGVANLPATRSVFETLVPSAPSPRVSVEIPQSLQDVAIRVNAAIDGESLNEAEVEASVRIVREALERIRSAASHNSWSLWQHDAADIGAGLVLFTEAQGLWNELATFLVDPNVQRSDKRGALDRLAFAEIDIPLGAREVFHDNSRALLESPLERVEHESGSPFSSALRFLAAHRFISEPEVFSLIAQLAGCEEPELREQAALTVAVLSTSVVAPWVLAQAMQLSHDREALVRAHAARALSMFASSSSDFRESAVRRLTEMMNEEGTLVPILVMRQLREKSNGGAPALAASTIGALAEHHASLMVRREAQVLLGEIG
ncbi:hypothetical protein ACFY8E_18310 [Streptomyces albidoflavus]|uniref:hypothetical protein n=1 Tax=Streptomyces albidoflavus TaxID=1886 RepID=UPI00078D3981|nr:hypothetical protein [Streptomyces albidoflavus]AMM08950.1 hypothetical protein Salbus254_2440 [Streptomyces albidoflavus]